MAKKLPYGQSNFADLIERGYAYVDKTRYIELLENESNTYQFLIRPRRFGKSLFLSALENYYNLNRRDKFEAVFGGLYIGKHPTPERGTYAVMRFNFSGLDTDSHEKFVKSFLDRIEACVIDFLGKYKNIFSNVGEDVKHIREKSVGVGALNVAYTAAAEADVPIFAIIDEYDHFANNLIAMGESYVNEVRAGGIVRTFYEMLKAGTDSVVRRIFITGITPMMINDLTSGFNISTDYSLWEKYNEILGFTSEDVDWLMRETEINKSLIKVDMELYYNGYMFNADGNDKVYNPQMTLFLLNQILSTGKQPKQVVDTNLKTDYARLRRLAENPHNRERLFDIVRDGGVFGEIIEKFSLEELHNENYFVSLLFYLGMLTNGGTVEGRSYLKIPNYSIKTLYWNYAVSHVQDLDSTIISTRRLSETMSRMAFHGDINSYLDFFTENFLKRLSNRDLIMFDEKYIKVMLLSTLFMSDFYLPVSEDENINGYTDIYLQKHPVKPDIKYEYVFEVKYVKTEDAAKPKIVEAAFAEAQAQIEKYKKDPRFTNRDDLRFLAVVFKGKGDYEARET